jgi:hypothetical protein
MASKFPTAVARLRAHLHDAIPDGGDLQQADSYLLDVLNSLHDDSDDDVGEAEGRKVDARGRVAGEDRMPPGMGLDRAIWPSARSQGAPLGLRKLFAAYPAPRAASSVR